MDCDGLNLQVRKSGGDWTCLVAIHPDGHLIRFQLDPEAFPDLDFTPSGHITIEDE